MGPPQPTPPASLVEFPKLTFLRGVDFINKLARNCREEAPTNTTFHPRGGLKYLDARALFALVGGVLPGPLDRPILSFFLPTSTTGLPRS